MFRAKSVDLKSRNAVELDVLNIGMDKLTQFVSRSFETNNGVMSAEKCFNLSSNLMKIYPQSESEITESVVKSEDQSVPKSSQMELDISVSTNSNLTPVAKNWLISDISKQCGIDLSINGSNLIYRSDKPKDNVISQKSLLNTYSNISKCFKNNKDGQVLSPINSYSSSLSPKTNQDDSKSCTEVLSESAQDNKYNISDADINEDITNYDQDSTKCE